MGKFILPFQNNSFSKGHGVNYRIADFVDQVGNGADMVVMAVGDNYSLDTVFFIFQIGDVGNDKINSRHIFFGKLQAHINNNNVAGL